MTNFCPVISQETLQLFTRLQKLLQNATPDRGGKWVCEDSVMHTEDSKINMEKQLFYASGTNC